MAAPLPFIDRPAQGSLIPAGGATFSPCGVYRYHLWRRWDWDEAAPLLTWLMLNPSKATWIDNDSTINRCIAFSKAWGWAGLEVLNLFAFRSTDPKVMRAAVDPIGRDNDDWLRYRTAEASQVVVAWGDGGLYRGRASHVVANVLNSIPLWSLSRIKSGQPIHPLYVRADKRLELWKAAA